MNDYTQNRAFLTGENICLMKDRGDRWLDAYYFGFDATGVEAIDLILAAVARAGKLAHSTEWWNDDEMSDGDVTPIDLIQRAANSAAALFVGVAP